MVKIRFNRLKTTGYFDRFFHMDAANKIQYKQLFLFLNYVLLYPNNINYCVV